MRQAPENPALKREPIPLHEVSFWHIEDVPDNQKETESALAGDYGPKLAEARTWDGAMNLLKKLKEGSVVPRLIILDAALGTKWLTDDFLTFIQVFDVIQRNAPAESALAKIVIVVNRVGKRQFYEFQLRKYLFHGRAV